VNCMSNLPPQSAELCLVSRWVFQTRAEMRRSETPHGCALQTVLSKTHQTLQMGTSVKILE